MDQSEPTAIPVAIPAAPGSAGFSYEIHLSRGTTGAVELPRDPVIAQAGSSLILDFFNHGIPLHLTVSSSDIGTFSAFSHENLYIEDRVTVTIPIRSGSPEGRFTVDIITGYGARKEPVQVTVIPEPACPPEPVPAWRRVLPVVQADAVPALILLSLLLFLTWLIIIHADLVVIAAFLALLGGTLLGWFSPR